MAIRAIWGFDHLPALRTIGGGGTGFGLAYSDYNITLADINQSWNDVAVIDNALSVNFNPGVLLPARVKFPLTGLTDGTSRKSHLSFNFIRRLSASSLGAGMLVTLGTDTPLVLASDFPPAIGVSVLIEFTIDRINKTITTYIDGKVKRIIRNVALANSWNSTSSLYLGLSQPVSYPGSLQFRDFVFIDDTQDNTVCDRPGFAKVTAVPFATASAPNWATAAASPLASLTTPFSTPASLTSPVLASNGSPDPLEVTLNVSGMLPNPILAVVAQASLARLSPGASLQFGIQVNDAVVLKTKITPADATMLYNKNLGIYQMAPGDLQWTPALLGKAILRTIPVASA